MEKNPGLYRDFSDHRNSLDSAFRFFHFANFFGITILNRKHCPALSLFSMKKQNYMSWETYFMSMGILSSFRSKDKKTQTGACIIGTDNKIISIGYNGLPTGLDDADPKFWTDDDDADIEHSKHTYVVHAERNAIYNAFGQNIKGSTMYATLFPCPNCAQTMVQCGIRRLVYLDVKK